MSIKNNFYRISRPLLKNISFDRFEKALTNQDLILVYHLVSDEDVKHVKHLFPYLSEKSFEKDLDYLSKYFDFTDWESYISDYHNNPQRKRKKILLTFDDGYAEFYNIIAPILKRKGIFAINFINPKFIDNKEMMWRNKASLIVSKLLENGNNNNNNNNRIPNILNIKFDQKDELDKIAKELEIDFDHYLKENKIYLLSNQLFNLKNDGFGISSHGWDHPLYNQLSLEEQLENTQKSINYMTNHGLLNDSFAFPFTDHLIDKEFFTTLFNRNPQLKFTFGAAGLKEDSISRNLQRIPMESKKYSAEEILKSEILYSKFLKIMNKNSISRS